MEAQKITIGRIVEFFPGTTAGCLSLPNSMTSAPAMAVQVFEQHVNFNVFTADPKEAPVKQAWSVNHKSKATEGEAYWDWFPRV